MLRRLESHMPPVEQKTVPGTVLSSRPAEVFSLGRLDGLPVRLRRPYVREATAGFGLERLAKTFMNTPGSPSIQQAACPI